ncbi:hypothetical protein F4677DRAFT_463905 [Hypoxylon crocopeplum]|nr:hypothetical protein F4677DRAFT_463905 [Hypoxylon crocopeplum]
MEMSMEMVMELGMEMGADTGMEMGPVFACQAVIVATNAEIEALEDRLIDTEDEAMALNLADLISLNTTLFEGMGVHQDDNSASYEPDREALNNLIECCTHTMGRTGGPLGVIVADGQPIIMHICKMKELAMLYRTLRQSDSIFYRKLTVPGGLRVWVIILMALYPGEGEQSWESNEEAWKVFSSMDLMGAIMVLQYHEAQQHVIDFVIYQFRRYHERAAIKLRENGGEESSSGTHWLMLGRIAACFMRSQHLDDASRPFTDRQFACAALDCVPISVLLDMLDGLHEEFSSEILAVLQGRRDRSWFM